MSLKGKTRNQRVITLKLILLVKPWNSIGNHTVQDCKVELRFSSCVCVYSQEKMCHVHLYHRVSLVDRNFLVQKYVFSCLPGTIGLAIKIEIYI